jgi:glycosyltransferase involved in cell wall biosynthesis
MVKVSIVIPAYNALEYLPVALDSIYGQTFSDFEVLIIDDGSKDKTSEWAKKINDPRIRYVFQHNQGVSAARNTGIRLSQGEYIAFLDADDLWEPTKLEKQVRLLENHPEAGLAFTWTAIADERGVPTGEIIPSAEGDTLQQLLEFNTVVCGGSVPMLRRSCFDVIGGFDTSMKHLEDLDLYIRVARKFLFMGIPEPLVRYRQHANSGSTDCDACRQSYERILQRELGANSSEPSRLRGFGRMYLYLGWRALESKNWVLAGSFTQKAVEYFPDLSSSSSFRRLKLRLLIARWGGFTIYTFLRQAIRNFKRQLPQLGH